jgi:hypothetical protein
MARRTLLGLLPLPLRIVKSFTIRPIRALVKPIPSTPILWAGRRHIGIVGYTALGCGQDARPSLQLDQASLSYQGHA